MHIGFDAEAVTTDTQSQCAKSGVSFVKGYDCANAMMKL